MCGRYLTTIAASRRQVQKSSSLPVAQKCVVDPTVSVVDLAVSVVDPTGRVVDPTVSVVDPTVSVVDPTVSVVDPTVSVVDPTVSVVDPTVNVVDPSVSVVDPTVSVVDPTVRLLLTLLCILRQVSHHPPIVAQHVEGVSPWVSWQEFSMSSKFRGKYIQIIPLGLAHLVFKNTGLKNTVKLAGIYSLLFQVRVSI